MTKERIPPTFKSSHTKASPASSKIKKSKPSKKTQSKGRHFQKFVMAGVWCVALILAMTAWFTYDMPSLNRLMTVGRKPSITFLAQDGQRILTMGDYYGQPVDAAKLPAHVKNAFLAIEDRRFYSHWGVDVLGLVRAAWSNYKAGGVVQGGSTITQQLAKNFLTTQGLFQHNNRSLRRKVQEVLLAFWLEHRLSKNQILTLYLNRVYFGTGAYGLNAAAHLYFNRQASDLNIYEAAILAGLMKAPSKYSPFVDQELSLGRGRQVLIAMGEAHYIKTAQLTNLSSPRFMNRMHLGSGFARYFTDWVYDQIPLLIGGIEEDLIVTTTLDLKLQQRSESEVEEFFITDAPTLGCHEGAVVAMTPGGAVKALVGGKHYYSSPFNRAYQSYRQSGSAFKYFVFLSALENGMDLQTRVVDEPFHAGKWHPRNYDRVFRGELSLEQAFAYSVNTIAARLTQKLGVSRIQEIATRLGLSQDQPNDLTISLGVGDASLLELTSAFAVVARGGLSVTPYGILQIKTRENKILYRFGGIEPERLLSPETAHSMQQMMQAVMTYGTGKNDRLDGFCAGKTGTTQNYKDAWFIGYNPQLVLGVWMGNDDNTSMDKVTGGKLPAKLWKRIMQASTSKNDGEE